MCVPVGLLKRLEIRERPGRWMHCFLRINIVEFNFVLSGALLRAQFAALHKFQ